MPFIVGIDSGLTGSLAFLNPDGLLLEVRDMAVMANGMATGSVKSKVNAMEVVSVLRAWRGQVSSRLLVYLEEPDPMPAHENKAGKRVGMPAASAKSMGRSIGVIEGVCASLELPIFLVKPATWKKALGLPRDKEVCRAKAIEWYPSAPLARKKDHNRAEAILIGRYGLTFFNGPAPDPRLND